MAEGLPEGEGEGDAEAQGDEEAVDSPVEDTVGLNEGLPLAEPLTVLLPAEEGEPLDDTEGEPVPLTVKLGEEDTELQPLTDIVTLTEAVLDTLAQPVGLPLWEPDAEQLPLPEEE